MKKIYHKIDSSKHVNSKMTVYQDEYCKLELISLEGFTLLSNPNLMDFVYGTPMTNIDNFFTPTIFSTKEYFLDIYKYKSTNYFEINQFVELLRVKINSKHFSYHKTKEKQLHLLNILEDYLEKLTIEDKNNRI